MHNACYYLKRTFSFIINFTSNEKPHFLLAHTHIVLIIGNVFNAYFANYTKLVLIHCYLFFYLLRFYFAISQWLLSFFEPFDKLFSLRIISEGIEDILYSYQDSFCHRDISYATREIVCLVDTFNISTHHHP